MPGNTLAFNGINGASGGYLASPMTPQELSRIVRGERNDQEHLRELEQRRRLSNRLLRGPKEGVDPKNLSQAGWGVIFAYVDREKAEPIKEALGPLLNLRQTQAGELYREYTGENAYRPGESKTEFLARQGAGPGPVDPVKVPYYLLIVGDPQAIPYRFQYQLDVQYAVGRIHFDTLDEYAYYAQNQVAMERGGTKQPRQAVFWGPRNPDDPATDLSATQLIQPLAGQITRDFEQKGWEINSLVGEQANKASLLDLIGGNQTPALLFSASHGMGFPMGDSRQLSHQGAVLCQDWPGPVAWRGPVPEDQYFSADDLASDSKFAGLFAFFFACYSAGTPQVEDFNHLALQSPIEIAPHPFIARLPRKMLSQPRGGALAVIGHVERAWGYSFHWNRAGTQLAVFESALRRLMEGHPVGSAFEYFNQRYAELSSDLTEELRGIRFGKIGDDLELAGMWTANNDARSYTILGDPAARMQVMEMDRRPDEPKETGTISIQGSRPEPLDLSSYDLNQYRDRLRQLAAKMGDMLQVLVDDATPLEVRTYLSEEVTLEAPHSPENTKLSAVTHVKIDGDLVTNLPDRSEGVEENIRAFHLEMVKQALINRNETIKVMAFATTSLAEALKILEE